MPRTQRRGKIRIEAYTEADHFLLLTGSIISGAGFATIDPHDRAAVKRAWATFKAEIMAEWMADPQHAGQRPWGYWVAKGLASDPRTFVRQPALLKQLGELSEAEEAQIATNRAEELAMVDRSLKASALLHGPGPWTQYDLETLKAAWQEYKEELLGNWLSHPSQCGSRPWAFWAIERDMDPPTKPEQERLLREWNELTNEEQQTLEQREEMHNAQRPAPYANGAADGAVKGAV